MSERLSFMSFEVRYLFEQELLPRLILNEEQTLKGRIRTKINKETLHRLLEKKGAFLVTLMNQLFQKAGRKCPYTENQFDINLLCLKNKDGTKFRVVTIDMPKPEKMPLCSRIIICFDSRLYQPQYYMVEKSFVWSYQLCGSDGECHMNYGSVDNDKSKQLEKVCELYGASLKPRHIRSDFSVITEYYEQALELLMFTDYYNNDTAIIDLYPMMFVIADYASFKAGKDRELAHSLIKIYWEKVMKFGHNLDEYWDELKDSYTNLFESRVDFYVSFIVEKHADMEFWLSSDKPSLNPVLNCTAAFCDNLYNPSRRRDYDHAPLLVKPFTESMFFSTAVFSELYGIMMDYYNDMFSREDSLKNR